MIIKKAETETHPVMEMLVDSMLILGALYFCVPPEVFEFISSIMFKSVGFLICTYLLVLLYKYALGDDD